MSVPSLLAKELERFTTSWPKEFTDGQIGDLQFGDTKGVSTTHMLIEMLDDWYRALETPTTSIRIIFLDFSKAFDRVNYHKLMKQLELLGTPPFLLKWCAAFLSGRMQSVKIGNYVWPPLRIHGAVPQDAIFGIDWFVIMIDDLKSHPLYIYVGDTTPFKIINDRSESTMQQTTIAVTEWTVKNDMRLNSQKLTK